MKSFFDSLKEHYGESREGNVTVRELDNNTIILIFNNKEIYENASEILKDCIVRKNPIFLTLFVSRGKFNAKINTK